MEIKKRLPGGVKTAIVSALICGMAALGLAQELVPVTQNRAYINIDQAFDFSQVKPAVNVHLPKFLLNNLISEFDGGPNDPFAEMGINLADLTNDIQLIRVVVFEAKDPQKNETVRAGIQKLKQSMSPEWMPIVNVPDGNVTIYAMGDETGERLAGLAMLVTDKNDTVIGNIVGEIQLGKIIAVASKLGTEESMGAKEALQKLIGGFQTQDASNESAAVPPEGREDSAPNP